MKDAIRQADKENQERLAAIRAARKERQERYERYQAMRATRRDDYSRDRKPQVEEQVAEAPAASEKVEVEARLKTAPVKKTTKKAALSSRRYSKRRRNNGLKN